MRIQRRTFFSLFLVLLSIVNAIADTKIVLHQKYGENIDVFIKEKPVAKYEGTELVITSEVTTLRFQLNSLEKVTFEDEETSVESITIICKKAGGTHIYDINGRLVKTIKENEAIDTSTLLKGMYIIKNNNHSYKIIKQ